MPKKKAGSALISIVRHAKSMRRAHPNKHKHKKNAWRAYMADASAAYKRGHKRKKTVGKKRTVRRKARKRVGSIRLKETHEAVVSRAPRKRKRTTAKRKTHTRRRKVGAVARAHYPKRRRSVGAAGSNTGLFIGIAALGLGALWLMTRNKTPATTTLPSGATLQTAIVPTSNATRNNQSANLLNYAIAAGYAADVIYNLIDKINSSSDAQVSQMYTEATLLSGD